MVGAGSCSTGDMAVTIGAEVAGGFDVVVAVTIYE